MFPATFSPVLKVLLKAKNKDCRVMYLGIVSTTLFSLWTSLCQQSLKVSPISGQCSHFVPVKMMMLQKMMTICEYLDMICRISRPELFCKKGILKNFSKFTGKYLCQRLFFNKISGLRPEILLKKRLWHRCFPVNFAKF